MLKLRAPLPGLLCRRPACEARRLGAALTEIDDAAGVDAARTAGLSGAAWKQAAQATQTSSNSERSAAILSTCNTDGSFALPPAQDDGREQESSGDQTGRSA